MIMLPVIWEGERLFFIIMFLPILAFSIKNIWIRVFLLYAFAWQIFLQLSTFLHPTKQTVESLTVVIFIILGVLLFKFVSESKIKKETWFNVIRVAVLIQVVISILQYFNFNIVVKIMALFIKTVDLMPGFCNGTLGNKDYLTAFIAISLPLFIGWKTIKWHIHRPFWLDLSFNIPLLAILFILFVGPTMATLAAIIGLAIYFRRGWKLYIPAFLLICGVLYYYVVIQGYHLHEFQMLSGQLQDLYYRGGTFIKVTSDGDIGRFGMWIAACGKLFSSWTRLIFGFGPAANWGMPYSLHSEYVTMFFEYGLVGLILLLGYVFSTARYLIKSKNILLGSCFVIAFLDIMATFNMHIAPVAFLVIIICGLIEREKLGEYYV
jgi:hypothetical protein